MEIKLNDVLIVILIILQSLIVVIIREGFHFNWINCKHYYYYYYYYIITYMIWALNKDNIQKNNQQQPMDI